MRGTSLVLAISGLALAACGTAGPGQQSWQESHSADQVFQAGVDARNQLHSFRITVTGTDSSTGQPETFEISVDGKGGAKGVFHGPISGQQVTFNVIVANGHTYLQGNAFWTASAGPVAGARIGDRWVDVTSAGSSATNPFTSFADVGTIRDCLLTGPHGTLSKGSVSSVDGYQAIDLNDKGDKPGTQPAKFYVDVDSPHYLVRYTTSGTVKPGGPAPPAKCNSGSTNSGGTTSNRAQTLDLHDANSVPPIQPPAGAVDIKTLAAGG